MFKNLPKIPTGWLSVMILLVLGLVTKFCLVGYSFSAYILWGLAALAACYQLLNLLAHNHPKAAKHLRWLLNTCIAIGLTAAIITGCYIYHGGLGDAEADCDYVIVLGAGVNGTVPSLILSNRIDQAYTYLTENPDVICIVSGGKGPGEDISEAQCMFERLTAKGIAPERIWMEDQSTSTRENFQFTLNLIEEKTGSRPTRLAVLSSEFHLFRAGLVGAECGIDAAGIPAKTSWFSLRINYYLREIAAVWYYCLLGG